VVKGKENLFSGKGQFLKRRCSILEAIQRRTIWEDDHESWVE